MCTNIKVSLPTVETFLLLYSLKSGCIIILLWTLIRSLFYLTFFIETSIEVYLPRQPLFGNFHVMQLKAPAADETYFFVYTAYLNIIVTESFLLIFTLYLMIGLYYESRGRIIQYLVCRFCTWLMEVVILVSLSLVHACLIGWYLIFLMIVILEFYAFIVVYSYCNYLPERDKPLPPSLNPC